MLLLGNKAGSLRLKVMTTAQMVHLIDLSLTAIIILFHSCHYEKMQNNTIYSVALAQKTWTQKMNL